MLKETYDAAISMKNALYILQRTTKIDKDRSVKPELYGMSEPINKLIKYADTIIELGTKGNWSEF